MTKDELEDLNTFYESLAPVLRVSIPRKDILDMLSTLKQVWQKIEWLTASLVAMEKRGDTLERERDQLVRKLNTLEDISEQHTLISNLQQQNTELLEDVAALRQEQKVLRASFFNELVERML